jgi:hypothetical protein
MKTLWLTNFITELGISLPQRCSERRFSKDGEMQPANSKQYFYDRGYNVGLTEKQSLH